MPKKKTKLPLSKTHPKLAKEADGWDPNSITFGSTSKKGWKCKKGHTWVTTVISRTRQKTGCPYCAGKRILKNYNDLGTLFPKIAELAYKWDPFQTAPSNKKQLTWKCPKGHKWTAKPAALTRSAKSNPRFNPCPACNSIYYTHPELSIFLADQSLAKEISKGSEKVLEWKCLRGHSYFKRPVDLKIGSGCPYCHGTKVLKGFNDLKTLYPEIAKEIIGIDPSTVTKSSRKRTKWKCSSGHTWMAVIGSRTSNLSGCPYCSKTKILTGFNDLGSTNPELAKEARGWDPSQFGSGSKEKKDWNCKRGHIFSAAIADRALKGSGCPYCSGNKVLKGFNDLSTTHPELITEANGWDPGTISAGSGNRISWKCTLGHIWLASPQSRALHKTNCPFCSGNKVLKGFNDLNTTHPIIASQAVNWDTTRFSFGSHKSKDWQCKLGHIYKATINSRTGKDQSAGCPYCSGSKVMVGFNDLATTHLIISKEAYKWSPKKYSAGSVKKLWWKCDDGHKWKTTPNSRTANGSGCPTCAKSGFDPNKPAWIYMGHHEAFEFLQIGISNKIEQRISYHKSLSWDIFDVYGPIDGLLAQEWETSILKMLRANGAKMGPRKDKIYNEGIGEDDSKLVGTEIWSKSTFPVKSIKELMRLTEEFEEGK